MPHSGRLRPLDTPPSRPYTPYMDLNNIPLRYRPAARRTGLKGFRLYQDQIEYLNQEYKERTNELMRTLIDEFMQGRVPAVKVKMMLKKGI